MTIVLKINGQWVQQHGNVELTREVSTRTNVYHDGRTEEEACTPYPIKEVVNIGKIEALIASGDWTVDDLKVYGLRVAADFVPPSGKRTVGAPRFKEKDGIVVTEYDLQDVAPSIEQSTDEKLVRMLSAYGLDLDELRAALRTSE